MQFRLLPFAGAVSFALLVGASADLWAEEAKPDFAAAKRAFQAGQELLRMDRYADAIVEFKKAYKITKDGLVMGQVAVAYERAGDFKNALEAMRIYREALPEADRASADELMKRYQKAIDEGRNKPLELSGAEGAVTPEGSTGVTPPPEDEDDAPPQKKRFWTWIAGGTAAALALGAMVVGLNAQSKFDELETTCKPTGPNQPGCPESEIDSVETRAAVADVLWGMAAAAAITTGVLYFVEGRGGKSKGEADEEDEELARRLRIAPIFGRAGVGIGATLKY